jgi:hypothetical protein
MHFSISGGREVTTKRQQDGLCSLLKLTSQVICKQKFRLWSSLKKFYGRHHELVNGYRMSVTQIIFDHRLQKGQSKVANPLRCPLSSSVEVPSNEGKDINNK